MKKVSLLIRSQISLLQPRVCSDIETARKMQDKAGSLEAAVLSGKVKFLPQHRGEYDADFALPKKPSGDAVILYLHGGGYTAGTLAYAKGFGGVLAELTDMSVLCVAYRLAPEFPYPAALDDVFDSYRFLRAAFPKQKVFIVGESAGGGLCYALCLRAKAEGLALPDGIVAISPWVDLTLSFPSHERNKEIDPSLSTEQLDFYAGLYAPEKRELPFVSPVFGDLSGLPDSLIFVGSHEILLDDSLTLATRLSEAGNGVTIHVEDGAWHAYVLYGIFEAKQALADIKKFISEHTHE